MTMYLGNKKVTPTIIKTVIEQPTPDPDGKSIFYIRLTKTTGVNPTDALTQTIYLNTTGAGITYIDWGDGTDVDVITTVGNFNKSHTYAAYGDYRVKVWRDSGSYGFGGSSTTTVWGGAVAQKRNALKAVYIGVGVTNIGSYTFDSCYTIIHYDLTQLTAVPSLAGTNAFSNINSSALIVVKDSLYEAFITATNWSTYANYIIGLTEYTTLYEND